MSAEEQHTLEVEVLGKTYRLSCLANDKPVLLHSAKTLDRRMQEVRTGGKVLGVDRVAVIAALQITHELVSCQEQQKQRAQALTQRLRSMNERVEAAINKYQPKPLPPELEQSIDLA